METTRLRQLRSCNLDVSNEFWNTNQWLYILLLYRTPNWNHYLPALYSEVLLACCFRLVKGDRSNIPVYENMSWTTSFCRPTWKAFSVDTLDSQQANRFCPGCRCGNAPPKVSSRPVVFWGRFCCWSSSERHRLVWKREGMSTSPLKVNHLGSTGYFRKRNSKEA